LRLGTFGVKGRFFPGLVQGNRVVDLARHGFADLKSLLVTEGALSDLSVSGFSEEDGEYALEQLTIMAPVLNPAKIICIGTNYLEHVRETEMEAPDEPVIFTKFARSLIGYRESIVIPRITQQVDYEAELAVIIGRTGRDIPRENAMDYVAGYSIMNDVSARDLQFRGGQWTKGKALDTFAPMGPYLVTKDEVGNPHDLTIRLWLNKQLMQDSTTAQMIFKVEDLISFLSELVTLEPGDIIATGTPPGVGFARKPPVFLQPGDTVKISIEKIGELENSVLRKDQ
jgi:2-keto-4-pentenoate hydratase/2-oxohepta-3-ene-1,7-dioic acid hydratase in catechol pathway